MRCKRVDLPATRCTAHALCGGRVLLLNYTNGRSNSRAWFGTARTDLLGLDQTVVIVERAGAPPWANRRRAAVESESEGPVYVQ